MTSHPTRLPHRVVPAAGPGGRDQPGTRQCALARTANPDRVQTGAGRCVSLAGRCTPGVRSPDSARARGPAPRAAPGPHVRGWAPGDPALPARGAGARPPRTHRAFGRKVTNVFDGADVNDVNAAVLGRERRVLLVDPHLGRLFAGTAGRRALPIHGPGSLCKRRRAAFAARSQGAGPSRALARRGRGRLPLSSARPPPSARPARAPCGCARPSPGADRASTWLRVPRVARAPGRELGRRPDCFP